MSDFSRRSAIRGLAGFGMLGLLGKEALAQEGPPAMPQGGPPRGFRDAYADQKRVLFVADLSGGNQSAHMAVSHAASVVEQIGRLSGEYVTIIRTDTDWLTKKETWGRGDYAEGGPRQARGKNLDYFDAVIFYTNGNLDMDAEQRQDLLDFVAKDGKGFVGIHTATATAYDWPEYAEMIGGVFDNHPWFISDAQIIVERPDFPAMRAFSTGMTIRDEHYQMKAEPYSRDFIDVLARIDPASVDMEARGVNRTDADFPIAWIRDYGEGRVFYTGLGHTDAAWDDPRIRTMMLEAVRWAIDGTEAARPHPITG